MTIRRLLEDRAAAHPPKTFLIFEATETSYGTFNATVNRVANGLRQLGVQTGDRICVMGKGVIMRYDRVVRLAVVMGVLAVGCLGVPTIVTAKDSSPRVVLETNKSFQAFTQDLTAAIRKNKMGQVCWASAQAGAASIGVKIPGNQVFMIYRPDFAVRMLKASVEAGFEAPIRIYVVEQENGTAQVSYIKPSDVFAGYKNAELNAMARELDTIFAAILHDAM